MQASVNRRQPRRPHVRWDAALDVSLQHFELELEGRLGGGVHGSSVPVEVVDLHKLVADAVAGEAAVDKVRDRVRRRHRECQRLLMSCWRLEERSVEAKAVRFRISCCLPAALLAIVLAADVCAVEVEVEMWRWRMEVVMV